MPVALTREGVAAVRARTARLLLVVLVAELLRDTTLREDTFVERVGVTERFATVRFAAFARDAVVLDADCTVVLDAVVRAAFARLFAVERGLCRPVLWVAAFGFTIGSANTERMETNVEHTKNAAANKNTVPIAFLQEFAFI